MSEPVPLANRRDKETEVRWGIAHFKRLFRRDPVGFWLPETAVDRETLDVLAAEGIQFTVLAPHQVSKPPERGLPARIELGNGRSIAVLNCFKPRGEQSDSPTSTDRIYAPGNWVSRAA